MPLLVGWCAAVGGVTFLQSQGSGTIDVLLAATLALLVAAVGFQLVTVSVGSIRWISPETDVILRRLAVGYPSDLHVVQPDLLHVSRERVHANGPESNTSPSLTVSRLAGRTAT
jgi:hypothetical protein